MRRLTVEDPVQLHRALVTGLFKIDANTGKGNRRTLTGQFQVADTKHGDLTRYVDVCGHAGFDNPQGHPVIDTENRDGPGQHMQFTDQPRLAVFPCQRIVRAALVLGQLRD